MGEKLSKEGKLTFQNIRKILGFSEDIFFNLQSKRRDALWGNRTDHVLRKILGNEFNSLEENKKNQLVTDLLTIFKDEALKKRFLEYWKFSEEITEKFMGTSLPDGYVGLSEKAIKRLLPHLESGKRYDEAKELAGLKERQIAKATEIWKETPSNMRNPTVLKAFFETRKLLKSIRRVYGEPTVFRVEMAREMRQSKREREEAEKAMAENEKRNETAKKFLLENGIQNPSRNDIVKYKLWEECGKICPYTGKSMDVMDVFGPHPKFDIEHIIPWPRSGDDSFGNKTLCDAEFNRVKKRNMTPYELGQIDPSWYQGTLQRLNEQRKMGFPFGKVRKFERQNIEDSEFVSRQLNDTRYISREIRTWLENAFPNAKVEISK